MIQRHKVTCQQPVRVVSNEQPNRQYTVGELAKMGRVCDYCNDYIFSHYVKIERVVLYADIENYINTYHSDKDVKESLDYLKNNIAIELDKLLNTRKKVYNVHTD